MTNEIAFEVKNLSKQFPGTLALSDLSLKLYDKRIHAIVGENGAGKSTLCGLMTGNIQPTTGEMFLKGEKVNFSSPAESLAAGVCMLYQERNMIPRFTGIENICLGWEPCKAGIMLDFKKTKARALKLMEELGLELPLDEPVNGLSSGKQQMIEILRAFYHNPVFMILDEPTASLGEGEIDAFLDFVKRARDDMGLPIIYITHKLDEVFQIADQVSVLTDGKLTLSKPIAETNMQEVVSAMLRQAVLDPVAVSIRELPEDDKPVLKVGSCTYDGHEHKLGFELRKGQVVGFYGLVGSGRTECVEVLYGIRRCEEIDAEMHGKKLDSRDLLPAKMIDKGMILTPESRANGIFYNQTIEDNINILFLNHSFVISLLAWIRKAKLREFVRRIIERHNVKLSRIDQSITELSGGNMQKTILGRSIETEHNDIMVLDEPTNGIDIGAKYEVYRKIRSLVEEQNRAVLFISSEINELLTICDRIYVFFDGNIVGEFDRESFSRIDILNLTLGRGQQHGN